MPKEFDYIIRFYRVAKFQKISLYIFTGFLTFNPIITFDTCHKNKSLQLLNSIIVGSVKTKNLLNYDIKTSVIS